MTASCGASGSQPALTPRLYGKAGLVPEMACNDGSRASGYPPDLVPFRRCWGSTDCDRPRAMRSYARGGLAFGFLEKASGNSRGRAGVPTVLAWPDRGYRGATESSADARDPMTSFSRARDRSQKIQFLNFLDFVF
jgi:hypothetical protein